MAPSARLDISNENGSEPEAPQLSMSVGNHCRLKDGGLEPIAIVGFSLKFPQDATSQEAFWSMLMEKRCAMTEWPSDRLNIEAYHHPDKDRLDTVCIMRPRKLLD